MKFYMYRTAAITKTIILDNTLKFTNPENFNDPFDFFPKVTERGLLKFIDRIENENGNGQKKFKRNHLARKKHIAYLRSKEFRNEYLKNLSIACFSRSPYILPMWAHYANSHKGCVLEFSYVNSDEIKDKYLNTPLENHFDILIPHDVHYDNERPTLFDEHGNTNKLINAFDVCLRKAKIWEYEQEVRVIQMQPEGIYPFNPEQLTGVYFGIKIDPSDKKEISNLIELKNMDRKIKIKKHDMEIAFDDFEISSVTFRF